MQNAALGLKAAKLFKTSKDGPEGKSAVRDPSAAWILEGFKGLHEGVKASTVYDSLPVLDDAVILEWAAKDDQNQSEKSQSRQTRISSYHWGV